ncbi:MAG TPA: HDOD domain-containing protein [Candidatus Limnocylindria bacterium]|nr:HDOD domain-containing protein [Candidatus Limnocylindria bacterium]
MRSIHGALNELLSSEQRYAGQIGEVIRRDPGLTTRLLKLVNSAYYGLSQKVSNLEEAVFYVGIRQIRELAAMTPVIEDFKKVAGPKADTWRGFWQHCIAVASLTRDLLAAVHHKEDDTHYVAGLIHDVGWLSMATVFPEHWTEIQRRHAAGSSAMAAAELSVLGARHTEIGAYYLECQDLSPSLVNTARFHHHPAAAGNDAPLVSAVQIADLLASKSGLGQSNDLSYEDDNAWLYASGWETLFGPNSRLERESAQNTLRRSVERLPFLLECLV